jgi:agmatine deiminase
MMRLPPEWAPQSGIMLTWPHHSSHWGETITDIDAVFLAVTQAVATHQKVVITCFDDAHRTYIFNLLRNANVNLTQIITGLSPSDDIWVRDHGPLTVMDDEANTMLLDFTFNGWGDKYPAENDNQITQRLYQQKTFARPSLQSTSFVLEGGGIEVDGHGTLLTTSSCLLSKSRNPQFTKKEIAAELSKYLGINRILWIDHGYLAGDDTDGHIDTLARFVDPYTICYVSCDDPEDEHYAALKAMEQQLSEFTNFIDKPYRLIPLPWPRACFADYDGRRLPASYANFLITNEAVLVPTYDDPADQLALEIMTACFPTREIIPIHSLPVIQWYGSIHCMTMQLPVGVV